MLFNEPKLLKSPGVADEPIHPYRVSVLFNEPKLLKSCARRRARRIRRGASFSALQRAEIAEIQPVAGVDNERWFVSVLFNEPKLLKCMRKIRAPFPYYGVSVLFNEPKLLKFYLSDNLRRAVDCFSALQRAEIAETINVGGITVNAAPFQCSSTSRNC